MMKSPVLVNLQRSTGAPAERTAIKLGLTTSHSFKGFEPLFEPGNVSFLSFLPFGILKNQPVKAVKVQNHKPRKFPSFSAYPILKTA